MKKYKLLANIPLWCYYSSFTLKSTIPLQKLFNISLNRKRFYASTTKGKKEYSLISKTLRKLDSSLSVNGFVANNDTQRFIESFVYNENTNNVDAKPNFIASVDTSILGGAVSNYVNNKLDMMNTYIDSLFKVVKQDADKGKSKNITAYFIHEVLSKVGINYILSTCVHHFLIILTQQHTQNDEYNYTNLLAISIKIGKKIVQKYLVVMNTVNKGESKPSYSSFLDTWRSNNELYAHLVDNNDTFNSILGCKIIEVLEFSDMLKKLLVRTEQIKQHHELVIADEDLMSKLENHRIYTVTTKLPMIVKPKSYSTDSDGGYKGLLEIFETHPFEEGTPHFVFFSPF